MSFVESVPAFAGVGEDLDLDQLMAASTTTNFTYLPSTHADGLPATSKSSAARKGTNGATISAGALNAEEILKSMNDPNILENDPLSDERNAAYASAWCAKVRRLTIPFRRRND